MLSAALSCAIRYIPVFAGISSGFAIIICAVLSSVVGTFVFPRQTAQEEVDE